MTEKISLARIYYPVKVLGPGNRVGIWTTGCKRDCPFCISPELKKYDSKAELTIKTILSIIGSINTPIDGFTISGGEPFYNPSALAALIYELTFINDDIIIYTGYTLDELQAMNDLSVKSVLRNCSVLIDGAYINELNNGKGLRGSSNQNIHIFKYYERYRNFENQERQLQTVVYGNSFLTIGIPGGER